MRTNVRPEVQNTAMTNVPIQPHTFWCPSLQISFGTKNFEREKFDEEREQAPKLMDGGEWEQR